MGCTDEKSISNKTQKKNHKNQQTGHNNQNGQNKKTAQKLNSSNDEIKNISLNLEEGKDQNNIKFPSGEEIENDKNIIKFENINNNEIKGENSNQTNNNKRGQKKEEDNKEDGEEDEEEEVPDEEGKEDKKDEEEEEEEEEDMDDLDDMNREMIRNVTPYLQSNVNPNFNFPEVKDNTYSGKGLRRMKGYISNVPKEELEKRRISFWGTRIEGDPQVWNFLRELCELPEGEEENLKAMLEANEIIPLKKCINVTYNKSGEIYEIPNYCINEPVSYDLPEMHMKKPEKQNINFHARKGAKQIKIKAFNTTLVDKVKSHISTKLQIDPKSIRLFFGGKEMKDGNELWVYKIVEDCVILIMCPG